MSDDLNKIQQVLIGLIEEAGRERNGYRLRELTNLGTVITASVEDERRKIPEEIEGRCYDCGCMFSILMAENDKPLFWSMPDNCVECYEKGGKTSGLRERSYRVKAK